MRLIAGATDQQAQKTLTLEAGSVVKAFDIPVTSDAFLFLKASDTAGAEIAVNDYFLPSERDEYDWKNTNWVTTPITRYASYRALNNLPRVTCQLTSKPLTCESNVQCSKFNVQCFELTLSNPSSTVAFFQRLMVKDAKGTLICPAYWSDNYVTLAPGESRTITCLLPKTDKNTQVNFEIEAF